MKRGGELIMIGQRRVISTLSSAGLAVESRHADGAAIIGSFPTAVGITARKQ